MLREGDWIYKRDEISRICDWGECVGLLSGLLFRGFYFFCKVVEKSVVEIEGSGGKEIW